MDNVSARINKMKIMERDDGRLEGKISINGKRKSFYGKTKSEVKNNVKQYLMKVENGYKEPENITLNEYMSYWLETYKRKSIEPNTYTRIYRVYENQIKNTIGEKKIGTISTKEIQNLINSYANPTDKDKKPLAKSGLEKIKHLLLPCMEMAVKEGIIQKNPCEDVVIPSENYITKETREQFSLTDRQIEKIKMIALERCESGNKYLRNRIVLLLLLNLGIRAGEMLALEWKDVDLDNKIVTINKTLQIGIRDFEGTQLNVYNSKVKKSTKTKSGMRTLPLNDACIHYFELLIDYDKENGIKSKYVCHTKGGGISNHRNLQKSLDCLINKTNIEERVTLHTLRHTYGSKLIRNGIRVEVVSKLMGHSSITITYNKYIHTIQEEEAKAMNIVTVC